MSHKSVLSLSTVVLLTCEVAAAQEAPRLEIDPVVQRIAETYRSIDAMTSDHTEEVLPHFAVDDDPQLILTSAVNQAVEVFVRAKFSDGRALPLGRHLALPSRHNALELKSLLEAADPTFRSGSLWISYLGTPETIQAWVVARRDLDATVLALTAPSDVASRRFIGFWGATVPSGSVRHTLHVLNTSPGSVRYAIWSDATARRWREIGADESHRVALPASHRGGWVQIEHEGEGGELVAQLTSHGPSAVRGQLPVWSLPSGYGKDFEALRIDLVPGSKATVTLWNSRTEPQTVIVTARDWRTSQVIWQRVFTVAAQASHEVPLPPSKAGESALRIQVAAERAGLLVQGKHETPSGEVGEISFIDHSYVHASGSYPILPVGNYDTRLTLLNLGTEIAEVVAQIYWDEGSHAIGPFVVEAGGSYALSVRELIELGDADMLGRTLPRDLGDGFLKWKVHRGSRQLLGRTEAIVAESGDRIGFNCLGCCWESPWGGIEPAYVDFFVGETAGFTAWVAYHTCNGTMGPFQQTPSSMTVPSPFSWDGMTVSASSAAEEVLSFGDWGEQVSSTCTVTPAFFGGSGVADGCKILLRKSHDPSQSWSTSQACTVQASSESGQRCSRCNSCCTAQRNYWTCKKKAQHIVTSEYNACIGHCATDHCS